MRFFLWMSLGTLLAACLSLFVGVADLSLSPLGTADEIEARLALLWVMFMSIKNASRMPDLRDRINPFLFLNRGTVRP